MTYSDKELQSKCDKIESLLYYNENDTRAYLNDKDFESPEEYQDAVIEVQQSIHVGCEVIEEERQGNYNRTIFDLTTVVD